MVAQRRGEGQGETLALGLTQGERMFEGFLACRPKVGMGSPRARSCCSVGRTSARRRALALDSGGQSPA